MTITLNERERRAANQKFLGDWNPTFSLAGQKRSARTQDVQTTPGVYSIDDLERLFAAGNFSAETTLLLQQIQDANGRVTETLNRSNAYRQLSNTIRTHIDKLRKYAGLIGKNESWKVQDLADATKQDVEVVRADLQQLDFKLSEDGTVVRQSSGNLYTERREQLDTCSEEGAMIISPEKMPADKLDLEIKRLEGEIHRIDGLREAEGLRIQELLQLKQRLVTLATNILQTTHKSLEAITNNTRT